MSFTKQVIEDIKEKNCSPELIAVVGPTCTGKSDLAIEVAKELNVPIINCDSRLIFQEMNIGTAKPTQAELDEVTHHLVNIKIPDSSYSAGDYRQDFDKVYNQLKANEQGIKAVVVGGTGLYIRSALDNLNMPEVSRNRELRDELNEKTLEELQKMVLDLDPDAHKDLDMPNKVRIIRAIEIIKVSGKPLAENRSKGTTNRYKTLYYGLNFESRRKLYDLINYRVVKMLQRGLVHEVEALVKKYGESEVLQSTIGYREILPYLRGEYSLSEGRRKIQKRTRLYAKKQMTWFNQNREIKWFLRST
jgi:tRNA dimethylallyltransferase